MDSIIQFLQRLTDPEFLMHYRDYLLLIVLVAGFLEVIVPPIPGDSVLVLASFVAGTTINPFLIIIAASVGTFSASLLLYNWGLKLEHKVFESQKLSWLLDTRTFIRVQSWFKRFGWWTILISRFLPVARSGVILAAGIVDYNKREALTALSASVLMANAFFVLIGRLLGTRWQMIINLWGYKIKKNLWLIIPLLIVLVLVVLIKKFWRKSDN
ncbi:MAG TPA: VTT domain-containing protein [Bacillota bacterium]|jgi:membrane protein DedA with SNARE-associated domain|nr:VTT domain-containing protein [Bacillota bacterium]HOL08547.1 VTT domain-containing protein [Bacillota bacterium]HPO96972.1 VTT domain-containing protein [Bacillota bacterium]